MRGEVWEGWDGLWQDQGLHLSPQFPEQCDPGDRWWLVGWDREKFQGIFAHWVQGMGCSLSGMGPSWIHGIPWESVPAGHSPLSMENVFIPL